VTLAVRQMAAMTTNSSIRSSTFAPTMTSAHDIDDLIARLRKVQALYNAPATDGERAAAAAAAARLQARLKEATSAARPASAPPPSSPPTEEFQIRIDDAWSRKLFIGIARHHGVHPYRYRGQRRTTLVVRTTKHQIDRVIMPHYREAVAVLRDHFDAIADRVIREALGLVTDETDERDERLALGGS
jgi:hypothetical protein